MDYKGIVEYVLATKGSIWLPEVTTKPIKGNAVNVINELQKGMRIVFDSYARIDKKGSIVDFVIKKGSSELLVGVWPSGFKLSDQQVEQIESAGRSYIAILADFIDTDTVDASVTMGSVYDEVAPGYAGRIYTTYWIYHSKHGWVYDKEERKIRI